MAARTLIVTPRLRLQSPAPALADAVSAHLHRNRAHFAPWDPPLPADHADPAVLQRTLGEAALAFAGGLALRWWLSPLDEPGRVVGSVHLSSIARGAFQSCHLGYALDADCQGRGLMHEALDAVVAEAFSPGVNLHRIQAAVRPENGRSLAVLARLGFRDEGLARDYLFIAGAWRDHRLFARTNGGFVPPEHWPTAAVAAG